MTRFDCIDNGTVVSDMKELAKLSQKDPAIGTKILNLGKMGKANIQIVTTKPGFYRYELSPALKSLLET